MLITLPTQRTVFLAMVSIVFCAMPAARTATLETTNPTPNVVRQVDHVLITSNKAKELFSLLTETFELPVAWPMSTYGTFASGGVAVGNVNLEVIQSSDSAGAGTASGRFVGLALEPEPLPTSLIELDARSIRHGAPQSFRSRKPTELFRVLWTTVALPTVSSDTFEVFLCEYAQDAPARRQRLREELRSRNGGPLSVLSIREIVCGASELRRTEEHWQKLLAPLGASSQGVWQIGGGPAIRVIMADKNEILSLIVNVKSLEQARRFLKERGLPCADEPAALTLAGSPLEGLNIVLVEQGPDGSQTASRRWINF